MMFVETSSPQPSGAPRANGSAQFDSNCERPEVRPAKSAQVKTRAAIVRRALSLSYFLPRQHQGITVRLAGGTAMATRCPSCDIVLTIEEADANVCPGCGGKISATMSSPQQGEHSPQAEHEPASESESLRTPLYWLVVAVLAPPAI